MALPLIVKKGGVADGVRTHDNRNHNPVQRTDSALDQGAEGFENAVVSPHTTDRTRRMARTKARTGA